MGLSWCIGQHRVQLYLAHQLCQQNDFAWEVTKDEFHCSDE